MITLYLNVFKWVKESKKVIRYMFKNRGICIYVIMRQRSNMLIQGKGVIPVATRDDFAKM